MSPMYSQGSLIEEGKRTKEGEDNVIRKVEVRVMNSWRFKKGVRRIKQCMWLVEARKGKDMYSLLEPPQGI